MNDDDMLYYLRCWSYIKGALPIVLNTMCENKWDAEDCAREIETIVSSAEAFACNSHKGKSGAR